MDELTVYLAASENWLLDRVLGHARAHGYAQYASTSAAEWRAGISGLSGALAAARASGNDPSFIDVDDRRSEDDPISRFAVREARRHRERGIPLRMFLGLFKYFRQSYVDLIDERGPNTAEAASWGAFIQRVFDRIEIDFTDEWAALTATERLDELQNANRRLTIEKNRFLAVFESLQDPVILLDREGRISGMSKAAAAIFHGGLVSGPIYYEGGSPSQELQWLVDEVRRMLDTDLEESCFDKHMNALGSVRVYRVRIRRIADVSEKQSGFVTFFSNVTDQKRVETDLKETASFQQQLLSNLPAGVLIVDALTRVIEATNTYVASLFGAPVDHLVGRRCHSLLCPASEGKCPVCDLGQEVDNSEREMLRVDGSRLAILKTVKRLRLNGRDKLLECFVDITDRKRIEDRHREVEARLQAIMDNSPVAIFLKGHDSRYLAANSAFRNRYGWRPDEIAGHTTYEIFPAGYADEIIEQEQLVLSTRRTMTFELVSPAGRRLMNVRFPVLAQDGRSLGVGCISLDVTEQKQFEDALRSSEARLNAVLENAPVSIFMKDVDGRYVMTNKAHLEWHELPSDQVIGKFTTDILGPEEAAEVTSQERLILDSGQSRTFEIVRYKGDNAHELMIVRFPVVSSDGRLLGVGGVTVDVTKTKSLERQLATAQKMQAIGQLTGGIAHDFNNLLQVIQTNLEIARDYLADRQTAATLVDHALRAGERGAALTRQLLAFSRRQTLHPTLVHVNGLIEGVLGMLARVLGEDVVIERAFAGDLPMVRIDAQGLENAVVNLALNARAAMPKGGRLTIRTEAVRFGTDLLIDEGIVPAGDYVAISVIDTGCGMTKEILARVFEPFFTTKGIGQGSGLGLSMVYGFTRQSGGHVELESEPAVGTTARILLPAAGEQTVAVGDAESTSP